jgi:serine/threonine-protein kinase
MREASVGDKVDQYELTELLARSGMASIFKAADGETGQTVALKVPHPHLESDVVFFDRFRREEEIGQRLEHAGIIKVLKPAKKTRMYMAMEYVPGRSLRAIMQSERAPLARERALDIARQVVDALTYLHTHGVVHRDVKPENVLVMDDGRIKIIDFGIALDESARRLTWFGLSQTIGTPDYMAPEQVGGRRGDARTDVYAVGMMLYEMLTRELPYAGANPHAILRAKTREDAKPPTYFVPGFDPSLEAIILKALERAPRDRYQSMAALAADLRDPAAVPPRDPETGAARRRGRGRAWLPRRMALPLAITAVLVGLGFLVWLSARR